MFVQKYIFKILNEGKTRQSPRLKTEMVAE
jgi:hypothetical protein